MAYQVTYEEDGTPVLRDQDGARIRYQDLTGSGIGMDDGRVILPSNVTADTINNPAALISSWAAQNPALWDQLAGNTFGGKVGGTAGLVAPGYMNPASMTGGLYDPNILFSDYNNDVYGVDVSGLRKSGYTPEEMAARDAFLAAHPGYGQVTASQMSENGAFKGAGPSAGNFIVDASKVQYDPTYGYITPTSNFGYAGGKGGHGEAVRALAAMAAAAFGASYFGPAGAGAGEAAGAGGGAGVFGGDFAGTAGLFETGANGLVSTSGALSGGAGAAGGFSGGAGGGGAVADGGFVGGASGGTTSGVGGFAGGASGGDVVGGIGGALSGGEGAGLGAGLSLSNAQSGGSALSRLFSGDATAADYAQLAGSLGSTALGAYGANQQADAYSDVANKYLSLGDPYRQMLLKTYDPNYSIADSPDFKNALDVGAQAAARATSAKVGNPVDNPGAYAEMQKYISGSLALPQLNTTRSQLGTFGQLGTNVAGANDTQAAGQTSGMYNALGYGLGQITQPQSNTQGALTKLLLNSSQYL